MKLEIKFQHYDKKPDTFFRAQANSYFVVYLNVDTQGLKALEEAVSKAAFEKVNGNLLASYSQAQVPLMIYYSQTDLQVVPLDSGWLICGDLDALASGLLPSIEACLANTKSDKPLVGYHSEQRLYDGEQVIGELKIVWEDN